MDRELIAIIVYAFLFMPSVGLAINSAIWYIRGKI